MNLKDAVIEGSQRFFLFVSIFIFCRIIVCWYNPHLTFMPQAEINRWFFFAICIGVGTFVHYYILRKSK